MVAPLRHCFRCFIRISMNNLKDIHNLSPAEHMTAGVVLSGFQWTIWRIYTTHHNKGLHLLLLFYQDFNEQFEGYTQHASALLLPLNRCFIRISMNNLKDIHNLQVFLFVNYIVVLSGFQWTIWRIYTTRNLIHYEDKQLFYQDFNEQFEGYTQLHNPSLSNSECCFIRISMNNLKDIHNV